MQEQISGLCVKAAILTTVIAAILPALAIAEPRFILVRHQPCNLFAVNEPVKQEVKVQGAQGQATATVTDYFGREVWKSAKPVAMSPSQPFVADIGKLSPGYYDLTVALAVQGGDGRTTTHKETVSFGVAEFVNRTAAQVRKEDFRFGLKMWYLDKAWWRGNAEWDEREVVTACTKLGLQWTRALLQQDSHLGTRELIQDFPMNVVLKVERFPRELYDAERYGPLGEWEKKYGKGAWVLKTLPKEQAYRKWLRQEVEKIPAEQNVFEIWNEAWDKMSPEDFAVLCNWISEVILEVRPDAVIGPNFLGNTSPYQFDARVIKAGGMKGMKMVALHPYGGSEDRAWMRSYRQWLREQLGHDVDIYITEYGSHSTPQGPAKRSEQEQAQRVVRQSLALYAEGVKALIPHWMGQREHNPTYIEDWFGFFRLNHQPKPVLLAYANCAAMIDGSRYVGDLWYGPEMESMLFDRDGVLTLALVTRGEKKDVQIDVGAPEVTVVDMAGARQKQKTDGGKIRLTIGPDAVYVVGLGAALAAKADKALRADRWPKPAKPPRTTRKAGRLKAQPVLDGKFDDWTGAAELSMINPKVAGDDASGIGYLAWDDRYLYVGVNMRDNEVLNNKPRAKLYQHDSLELFVSTEPREDNAGYGPRDHQFFITPTSGEGKPIVGEVVDREAGKVVDVKDARHFVGKTKDGWAAEVAIPWSTFADFAPKNGAKLALELRVNDADSSHERFKIDPEDGNPNPSDPTVWSFLLLVD